MEEFVGGHRRVWIACVASFSIGGCASPFVAVDSVPVPIARLSVSRQNAYKAKIQELAQVRRGYAYGVYGIGAALIGMGAAKVHSSALAGTAIGGAALYGLGLMDTNSLHAKIYEEGIKQLGCANTAVAPMHATAITDLRDLVGDLKTKEKAAAEALGNVFGVPGATTSGDAPRIIEGARTALTAASTALTSADSVFTTSAISGNMLHNTILAVDAAVVKDIDESTIKVAEVPGMIARISENTKLFSTYSAAGATFHPSSDVITRPGSPTDSDVIAKAVGKLQETVALLVSATNRVSTKAAEIKAAVAAAGSLADCKYQSQVVILTVSPATLVFDEGDTGSTSRRLSITGGRSQNYTFRVLGADASIFQFNNPVVTPTKALPAKPSSYQAEVRDGLEAQIVTINVTPKPAAAANTAGKGGTGDGAASLDYIKALSPLTLGNGAKVQILDAKKRADNKIEVTYKKISGEVTDAAIAQAIAGDDAVVNQLGPNPPIVAVASTEGPHANVLTRPGFGPATQGLSRIQVDQIQRKLGMSCDDVDGLWGMKTRKAFVDERTRRQAAGKAVPTHFPDENELREILKQPDITTTANCPEKPYAKKQ